MRSPSGSQAIVNDAAGTLGVDPAKLSDALKKALKDKQPLVQDAAAEAIDKITKASRGVGS